MARFQVRFVLLQSPLAGGGIAFFKQPLGLNFLLWVMLSWQAVFSCRKREKKLACKAGSCSRCAGSGALPSCEWMESQGCRGFAGDGWLDFPGRYRPHRQMLLSAL